jgi:hypothetical protein
MWYWGLNSGPLDLEYGTFKDTMSQEIFKELIQKNYKQL